MLLWMENVMFRGETMLYRKIAATIETHLLSDSEKIMLVDGARQIGKTYIIRHVGQKCFDNFIEINLITLLRLI